MARLKLGVLISGRGTNLQAILDVCADENFPADVAIVLANRPDAAGLERAKRVNIATEVIDHKAFPDRPSFERAMNARLDDAGVDLICLAGFMRLLTPTFVDHWAGRAINIHPSVLPAYPGLNTHQRAIDDGVRFAGCTVHFLSAEMDAGPIIAQATTPIMPEDTADTLAARVLDSEHEIYRRAIRWIAEGRVKIMDGRVQIDDVGSKASFYLPTAE
jgi:phosphoribosylglycinamide formyltransferase-1